MAAASPVGRVPDVRRRRSSYSDASVGIGIVHLGLGAFHRAHQAAYLDAWLERNGGGPWGICAANLRSNQAIVDALAAQGCRFHLAAYRDRDDVELREIRSIRRALFARDDQRALFAALSAPSTRIVTLAVTEKAYGLKAASGELDSEDPAIAHDLREPERPESVPGVLVEALRLRRLAGIRPFTVLCCDNMPANGRRTRLAVTELARRRQNAAATRRIGVLRGPDYLGLRTLCEHAEAPLDALVMLAEPGRALDARDVEHVSGRRVVAVVDHTPVVARTIDAGLLVHRLGRLREFAQLRTWITQIATEEAPCVAPS